MTSKSEQVGHLDPYAYSDSLPGIAEAAKLGYGGVDVNLLTCWKNRFKKKRMAVCTHWSRWWEHGFEAKPGRRIPKKPIEELTWWQVRGLRSKDGHHTIPSAKQALDQGKKSGVFIFFEMKPSVWGTVVLNELAVYAKRIRVPLIFMTIQAYGKTKAALDRWEKAAYHRLWLAHFVGANTVLLWRRKVDWAHWTPVLTAVKGKPGTKQVMSTPALIRRLRQVYSLR